jgi:DNA-binding NarL/FixJ family response regulator
MDGTRIQRILMVDSCALSRMAVCVLLDAERDLQVSLHTANMPAARSHCATNCPDLIIADLVPHQGGALELLRELPKLSAKSRVLVMTSCTDWRLLERALRMGAQGLVSKADPPGELAAAIRSLLADRFYASPSLMHLVLLSIGNGKLRAPLDISSNLSSREFQVFDLMGCGYGAKAIAAELGVSVRTVESHQIRMKEKLQMKTCVELKDAAKVWTRTNGEAERIRPEKKEA